MDGKSIMNIISLIGSAIISIIGIILKVPM